MSAMTAALILLLAWSLFAFGAVYDWAFGPVALLAIVCGIASFFTHRSRHARTWLDVWLLVVATVALVQLVPLPESIRSLLAPNMPDYLRRVSLTAPVADAWLPLSLYPAGWLFGAGACLTAVATFFWARDTMESRGIRLVIRSVAWMGLAVSVFALIQSTLFPSGLIYGFWAAGERPTGPIVSRNHYAAWIVLAWPMTVGYLFSHGRTHWQGRRTPRAVLVLSDSRAVWLVLAAAMMLASLLITQSRGGAIGFGVAVLVLVLQLWRRTGAAGRMGLVGFLVIVSLAVTLWASPDALVNRFDRAWSGVDGGRPDIWAQTLVLVRTFPVAGIGLGAFDVVMPAYQTSVFTTLLNHAHNQYLHVMAEGGLLLIVPLLLAAIAFFGVARRRLRHDDTALVHLRQGAFAGLIGFAVLSCVEVALLTPAVMVLASVSAAIVVRGQDEGA
jgi:O-antigen ligase